MFPLLIKVRLLGARNTVRDALQRHLALTVLLAMAGIALFAAVYIGFLVFFHFGRVIGLFDELVYQIFYFLFLFLFAGAVPFVASTLLHSADYGLLFNAPVPPRAVVAAKLLDATLTNSVQFFALGLPGILACANALNLPLVGWLLILPIVALFVLLPALLTAFGLLLLLAVFGIQRLRAAIAVLNAVMAFGVCATIVLEAAHLPRIGTLRTSLAATYSPTAHLMPSAWFARIMLALSKNTPQSYTIAAWEMGKIVVIVAVLFALCVSLGGRLLSAANVAEENQGARLGSRSLTRRRWWRLPFSAPVAAMIAKDFTYTRRDSVLISQLAMPLILFLVPLLLSLQSSTLRLREELYPSASVMIAIILFMQTSILSLSSVGLEGRSFWIVLNAPSASYRMLWAKFVMSTVVSGGVGIVLTLISGATFRENLTIVGIQCGLVIGCAAGLCGLGVGISAALPRFVYDNPAHRVSGWALIFGFVATLIYISLSIGAMLGAWVLTYGLHKTDRPDIVWGAAGVFFLMLTFLCVVVPISIGSRRIATYQWEY